MSRYFVNKDVKQPNLMAAAYHRECITEIKKSLGSKCVFLQHVEKRTSNTVDRKWDNGNERLPKGLSKNSEHFVEARFLVEGGKKKVTFKVAGTPSDISNQSYLDLQKQLMDYARTEKII